MEKVMTRWLLCIFLLNTLTFSSAAQAGGDAEAQRSVHRHRRPPSRRDRLLRVAGREVAEHRRAGEDRLCSSTARIASRPYAARRARR
jgi:hypothetical protein